MTGKKFIVKFAKVLSTSSLALLLAFASLSSTNDANDLTNVNQVKRDLVEVSAGSSVQAISTFGDYGYASDVTPVGYTYSYTSNGVVPTSYTYTGSYNGVVPTAYTYAGSYNGVVPTAYTYTGSYNGVVPTSYTYTGSYNGVVPYRYGSSIPTSRPTATPQTGNKSPIVPYNPNAPKNENQTTDTQANAIDPFANYANASGHQGLAQAMLDIINAERQAAGLNALKMDDTLVNAAQQRSNEALYNQSIGHTRPDNTGFDTVFNQYGYDAKTKAENLLWNQNAAATAEQLVKQWRDSPGHYGNYMEPTLEYCGLAVSIDYNENFALSSAHIFATK